MEQQEPTGRRNTKRGSETSRGAGQCSNCWTYSCRTAAASRREQQTSAGHKNIARQLVRRNHDNWCAMLDITSKSRITNSSIQSGDLDEPLAPILNSEGKKSSLYPSNLRSLFAYDGKDRWFSLSPSSCECFCESVETAKKLNKDCGLVEAEELDKNLKQFLAHIGNRFRIWLQGDQLTKWFHQGTRVEVVVQGTED